MEKKFPLQNLYQPQLASIQRAEELMKSGIEQVMLVSDTHVSMHDMSWLASPNEIRGKSCMLRAHILSMPQEEREKFLRNCIVITPSFENTNRDLFDSIEANAKLAGMVIEDCDDFWPTKAQDDVVENPCRETATTTDMFRMFRDRQAKHAKRGRK